MNKSHQQKHPESTLDKSSFEEDCLPLIHALKDQYPSLEKLDREINAQNIRVKKRNSTLIALSALIISVASVWFINPVISSQQFATQYAQRSLKTLSDGSQIHLNSNTRLLAEIRLRSREITLLQGEASFQVAHGIRPFYVAANAVRVQDIGTVFNVDFRDNEIVTTVQEGLVEITAGLSKSLLSAGNSLKVSGSLAREPYPADMEAITAWQSGNIIFDKAPLSIAMQDIMRYRKAPIVFMDQQSAQLRMTGIYNIDNIEPLLDSLSTSFPVNVVRRPNGEVQISMKK